MRNGVGRWMGEAFWVIALGIVLVYAFFLVLGAITPGDVVPLSMVVGLLVVLYAGRTWWQSRHPVDGRDSRLTSARERRGF